METVPDTFDFSNRLPVARERRANKDLSAYFKTIFFVEY